MPPRRETSADPQDEARQASMRRAAWHRACGQERSVAGRCKGVRASQSFRATFRSLAAKEQEGKTASGPKGRYRPTPAVPPASLNPTSSAWLFAGSDHSGERASRRRLPHHHRQAQRCRSTCLARRCPGSDQRSHDPAPRYPPALEMAGRAPQCRSLFTSPASLARWPQRRRNSGAQATPNPTRKPSRYPRVLRGLSAWREWWGGGHWSSGGYWGRKFSEEEKAQLITLRTPRLGRRSVR